MEAVTRDEFSSMVFRLQIVEGELSRSREEGHKRDLQYKDMMEILIDIRSRLDRQDGATSMAKTLWTVFGAIIIATILGVSGILWTHNAKIAALESIKGGFSNGST